ncbi:putative oligoketide cyclase/dehydratase [alpha proteobacterium U9-1i]|nr:putative oligoketide cyclase/dehydratase [alpha proteobacterium U9-1i]
MPRTIIEQERVLPYAPADLCRLVADVRAYPKFIPWLKSLKVTRDQESPNGGWDGEAEVLVGWQALTERFSCKIRSNPQAGAVDVTGLKGPFRSLENRWRFVAAPDGGAKAHFWIAYEFKNPLLQSLLTANRDRVAQRILAAFENEAKRRLG